MVRSSRKRSVGAARYRGLHRQFAYRRETYLPTRLCHRRADRRGLSVVPYRLIAPSPSGECPLAPPNAWWPAPPLVRGIELSVPEICGAADDVDRVHASCVIPDTRLVAKVSRYRGSDYRVACSAFRRRSPPAGQASIDELLDRAVAAINRVIGNRDTLAGAGYFPRMSENAEAEDLFGCAPSDPG